MFNACSEFLTCPKLVSNVGRDFALLACDFPATARDCSLLHGPSSTGFSRTYTCEHLYYKLQIEM